MTTTEKIKYATISASPVKSFFVSMLTRDITLEDTILDLLDNCVDGIIRSKKSDRDKPYKGYRAEIDFNADLFTISDNCGGIPWKMHNYAFRMGKPTNTPVDAAGTVGVYGIGMKRAIFKIGKYCLITTQNGPDRYEIEIATPWFTDEKDWNLTPKYTRKPSTEDGTTIVIGALNDGIKEQFDKDRDKFTGELIDIISTNYAYIINKGFQVKINGQTVKPRDTKLIFDINPLGDKAPAIQPYIFKTKTDDGVEVFLAVGFTRPIPTQSEIESEQEQKRFSSEDAGWTIICNDRTVVFCDRTELTGWGDAGIPRFHTQFIAISGIVEFKSDDASKLPTTTTKRGINANLPIYAQIKNKMREGMRQFTDYTNKWKGKADEVKKQMQDGNLLSLNEIKEFSQKVDFNRTIRSFPAGEQYKPTLPMPKKIEPTKRRITFVKDLSEINRIAEYLDTPYSDPSEIGVKCFDIVLEEAKQE